MLATATLLAALLPAALSDACDFDTTTRARFAGGRVELLSSGPIVEWLVPTEVISGGLVCDASDRQLALLGADGRGRVQVWVLKLRADGWQVQRALKDLPTLDGAALKGDRLALGIRRRGAAEFWVVATTGSARPEVRTLGAPVKGIILSDDEAAWWVASGNELRGFDRYDGATRESFLFPAALSAIARIGGSALVAVAWSENVILVDLHDRPVRGVLPVHARAATQGTPSRLLATSNRGGGVSVVVSTSASLAAERLELNPGPGSLPASAVRGESQAMPRTAESPRQRDGQPPPTPPAPSPEPPPSPAREPQVQTSPPAPCIPEAGENGAIVGWVDDPSGLALEVVVHGPDNLLREAARAALRPGDGGGCFRIFGLTAGHYRVQLMGAAGGSLRTRPAFGNVELRSDRPSMLRFSVAGKL